jgi:hypothetical protein
MVKQRASIFNDDKDEGELLDVSSFAPKLQRDSSAPPPEEVRAVSQTAHFRSREATAPKLGKQSKRPSRQYRTGRNVPFSAKVSQETNEAIYAVTDANPGWVLGYTLQRAMEALQRELKKQQ